MKDSKGGESLGWNYRVMRRWYRLPPALGAGTAVELGIYEVYYDSNDNPDGWASEPSPITVEVDASEGEAQLDLEDINKKIGEALKKPILDYNQKDDV